VAVLAGAVEQAVIAVAQTDKANKVEIIFFICLLL